jgi:hypothetical protein
LADLKYRRGFSAFQSVVHRYNALVGTCKAFCNSRFTVINADIISLIKDIYFDWTRQQVVDNLELDKNMCCRSGSREREVDPAATILTIKRGQNYTSCDRVNTARSGARIYHNQLGRTLPSEVGCIGCLPTATRFNLNTAQNLCKIVSHLFGVSTFNFQQQKST